MDKNIEIIRFKKDRTVTGYNVEKIDVKIDEAEGEIVIKLGNIFYYINKEDLREYFNVKEGE